MAYYAMLAARGLLALSGADARRFLQGMISNDIDRLAPTCALYAALLSPQGKYLHDFVVVEAGNELWLDCERARLDDLVRRLSLFRLRSAVEIADRSAEHAIAALWGRGAAERLGLDDEAGNAAPFAGGIALVDPRLRSLGCRAILPREGAAAAIEAAGFAAASSADYDRHRLRLGVPDGSRDMPVDKSFLLESNFEDLNGVDFDKGCYVGQENTARQKHRGTVRKRLMRVDIDGPLPDPGTPILLGETAIGEIRSGRDRLAMALMRLDHVAKARADHARLRAGEATVVPVKPDWATY